MSRIRNGLLALTYLAGANVFAYYDVVIRANPNLESVIQHSATWPLRVFSLY